MWGNKFRILQKRVYGLSPYKYIVHIRLINNRHGKFLQYSRTLGN